MSRIFFDVTSRGVDIYNYLEIGEVRKLDSLEKLLTTLPTKQVKGHFFVRVRLPGTYEIYCCEG
jgi:hypothetical protein